MPREYLTVREYATVNNIPEQQILSAIKDGKIDHCTMLVRKYERVYLIPSNVIIPVEYVPDVSRFPGKEVPPWQNQQT